MPYLKTLPLGHKHSGSTRLRGCPRCIFRHENLSGLTSRKGLLLNPKATRLREPFLGSTVSESGGPARRVFPSVILVFGPWSCELFEAPCSRKDDGVVKTRSTPVSYAGEPLPKFRPSKVFFPRFAVEAVHRLFLRAVHLVVRSWA